MARRVLSVREFTFREKGKKADNAQIFSPANLYGHDLGDLFYAWASQLSVEDTHDRQRNFWVDVKSVRWFAPHVVLLDLAVGSTGEPGQLVDAHTGQVDYEVTENHAATGLNRALLFAPPEGLSAFFFAESSRRGSGGTRIRTLFEKYIRDSLGSVKMESSAVSEGELWQAHAELKKVELRVEGKTSDIASEPETEVGSISHIARPKRRHAFPRDLLGRLRNDKHIANKLVSVPDETDGDVFVTLDDGERQKTFEVDGGGAPSFRLVISNDEEPALSDAKLVKECVSQLSSITPRTGRGDWRPEWSTPNGEDDGEDLTPRNP